MSKDSEIKGVTVVSHIPSEQICFTGEEDQPLEQVLRVAADYFAVNTNIIPISPGVIQLLETDQWQLSLDMEDCPDET